METRGKPGATCFQGPRDLLPLVPPGLFPQSPEFPGALAPQCENLVLPGGAKEPSSQPASHPLARLCGVCLGSTQGFKDLDSEVT